jgi:tight adherence protein C
VRALVALLALTGWVGVTLVLDQLRWFRRSSLVARLAPYIPGGRLERPPDRLRSARALLEPVADAVVTPLSKALGVQGELDHRLRRIHSPLSAAAFRNRQVGWAIGAFVAVTVACLALRLPALPSLLFLLGAPLLAVLVLEQQAVSAASGWQRRVFLELPVVTEQLGMLLGAGYSLGAALNRLAGRGKGSCARDLGLVCARIRQGVGEIEALGEWSASVDVDAVARLVNVLALNRDGSDLGRLIAEESRAMRREAQRDLIEVAERRAQQVWIPVTVATLVPGVLFLAVPFVEAMRLFTTG